MFTGIIGAVGEADCVTACGGGALLEVRCPSGWLRAAVGDSIAANGVCLTAATVGGDRFGARLSPETLARVAPFRVGMKVNLEAALAAGAPMGGHFVGGHIDGVARVVANDCVAAGDADGECRLLRLAAPAGLRRYFAPKCAVAVGGVSLTVNQIGAPTGGDSDGGGDSGGGEFIFSAQLVPHTLAATTLGDLRSGDLANLETDMIARHLEALLEFRKSR